MDEAGAARRRLPGRYGRARDRRGADRQRRLHHVHRLDRHRQGGDGTCREDAHASFARARRQGPDDRLRRCRRPAGRQRRDVLLDEQQWPDLHLGRAGLRRAADLRQFVAKVVENVQSIRQGPPAGPGEVEVGAITAPGQIDIIDRHVIDAREKGARSSPAATGAPATVASTSRPSSSTSTTRCCA